MKQKQIVKVVAIAAVVILLLILLLRVDVSPEDILQITPDNIFAAALVLIGIFLLKNVIVVIPLVALYIVCGMLFGAVWGIVVAVIGLTCEMSLGYWIGRKLGKNRIQELIQKRPKASTFFDLLSSKPHSACFLARLIPLPVPVDLVSMFFGASGYPFRGYLVFSLLGVSGGMLPYVIAGKSISNPLSAEFIVPLLCGIGFSILVFVIYRLHQKRSAAKEKHGDEE